MNKKIKTAIILAAGKGNRIAELPLTRILPKPMLPLLNRPVIEHIIRWLKGIGIEKIFIIVNFKREIIEEYFGDGTDFGVKIDYVLQPDLGESGKRWGLADVINLCAPKIKRPFVVVLGDDLTINKSFNIFVETFFAKNALVVEAVVKDEDKESLKRACSVKMGSNGRILDIVEKPEKPLWKVRGCGIYVFDPLVFEFIKKTPADPVRGGKDITKTIQVIAAETERTFGIMVEKNININTLEDLNRATLLLLKKLRN